MQPSPLIPVSSTPMTSKFILDTDPPVLLYVCQKLRSWYCMFQSLGSNGSLF